jgi:ubiquinone/menaquinone biosynthesis C-methylase UbiE
VNPYERYVLPWVIDLACGAKPMRKKRAALVPRARGRVLEIGIGTGHNLPFYDRTRVTELIGLDPAEQMQRKARKRAEEAGIEVDVRPVSAEGIPLPDAHVDTVVCTFTLCTIPDPGAAVAEMRRVLKSGGELIFCEHGLAPDPDVRKWQHRLNPVQNRIGGGCNLDRDIGAILGSVFDVSTMETGYLPGPKFAGFLSWGTAT